MSRIYKCAIFTLSVLLLSAILFVVTFFLLKPSEDTSKQSDEKTEFLEDKKDKFDTEPAAFEIRHHKNSELQSLLESYATNYSHLARVYSIGKSVEGTDLLVIEISDNPGVHEPGEPEVKLIGGIHGNLKFIFIDKFNNSNCFLKAMKLWVESSYFILLIIFCETTKHWREFAA